MSQDLSPQSATTAAKLQDVSTQEASVSPAHNDVDVTVIIPCYNVERTVEQCVASVCRNNRVRLEVLCINDGSTDATLAVLEEVASKDPQRIRLINKTNGGYGAAVNRGLSEARGRYVAVAEPDDYVAPHMYDDLFELAQSYHFPCVVKSSYWRVIQDEDGSDIIRHCDYFHLIAPRSQPFTLSDAPELLRFHPSIWSCLYRRDFLDDHHIRFLEVPGAGWVDNPFFVQTLTLAPTIVYTDTPYYFYREDLPGSSSTTLPWETRYERWHQMMDALEASGLEDPRLKQALYVVAFRYMEGVMDKSGDEERAVLEKTREVFERMDLDLVASLDTVAPALRSFVFELRGLEPPELNTLAYLRSLMQTGFHSLDINGPSFTLDYVRKFLRSSNKRQEIAEKTTSAS